MSMRKNTRIDVVWEEESADLQMSPVHAPAHEQGNTFSDQYPRMRMGRVQELREAITKGTYFVPIEVLADCLLRRMLRPR